MFRTILVGLILVSPTQLWAQYGLDPVIRNRAIATQNSPPTYNSEVLDALKFLQGVPDEDRSSILFFSTLAVPTDLSLFISNPKNNKELSPISMRKAVEILLNFTVHSLSSGSVVKRPKQLTETLWYVDIRDYEWTNVAVEKVSIADPYFVEPWVDHDAYSAMRIEAGNNILRADWFIAHVTDVLKQVDAGREPLYYELLFAKAGVPKNLKEFQDRLGINIAQAEKDKIGRGTIVDTGKSIVAAHNRQLYRIRTGTGYYWQTQDVKAAEGNRDYIENIVPFIRKRDFDAMEVITTNRLGLQVYSLFDGKTNRIEFADNAIATDGTKVHDKRVGTPRSCIQCHNRGINEASNGLRDHLNSGLELRYALKEDALDIEAFFLDNRFNSYIKEDSDSYNATVQLIVGIPSFDLVRLYQDFMIWYEKPLSLDQIVLEVAKSKDEIINKLSHSIRGRLGYVLKGGTIPRQTWEEPNRGVFAEAMLLIYNLEGQQRLLQSYSPIKNQKTNNEIILEDNNLVYITIANTVLSVSNKPILDSNNKPVVIPKNTRLIPISTTTQGQWVGVEYNGFKGWVVSSALRRVNND